ncbi:MAG: hypothetical protein JXA41_09255 [Deltaproteobacteria bacterium]|nr:hypothetical protein [Deltaproteobacteria bacterium]
MAEKFVRETTLKLFLHEVFDVSQQIQYLDYADPSRKVFDMILESGVAQENATFLLISPFFSAANTRPRGTFSAVYRPVRQISH